MSGVVQRLHSAGGLTSPPPLTLDGERLFEANNLKKAVVDSRLEPYPMLVAQGLLPESAKARIVADFPRYHRSGFFPMEAAECGPSVIAAVNSVIHPAFADTLGQYLGVENLSRFPTLVTLRKWSKLSDGRIHNDGRAKVVTALLYLNETWPDSSAGCFRFLTSPDSFENMAVPEIKPLYGYFAAFRRTENSWHGHPPYKGERRVIQVAWLVNKDELERKQKRGRFTRFVKSLLDWR